MRIASYIVCQSLRQVVIHLIHTKSQNFSSHTRTVHMRKNGVWCYMRSLRRYHTSAAQYINIGPATTLTPSAYGDD